MITCKNCINLIKKIKRIKGEKQTVNSFKCLVDGERLNLLDIEILECNKKSISTLEDYKK